MPTKRQRRGHGHQGEPDRQFVELHISQGSCLLAGLGLACHCGLIDRYGVLDEPRLLRLARAYGIPIDDGGTDDAE